VVNSETAYVEAVHQWSGHLFDDANQHAPESPAVRDNEAVAVLARTERDGAIQARGNCMADSDILRKLATNKSSI
jgi:hypothetical protein